jgi:hypothetical protein
MSLDAYLPSYDVREFHSITIDASPERVIAAARELRGRDVPLATILLGLRRLPALLRGGRVSFSRPLVASSRVPASSPWRSARTSWCWAWSVASGSWAAACAGSIGMSSGRWVSRAGRKGRSTSTSRPPLPAPRSSPRRRECSARDPASSNASGATGVPFLPAAQPSGSRGYGRSAGEQPARARRAPPARGQPLPRWCSGGSPRGPHRRPRARAPA